MKRGAMCLSFLIIFFVLCVQGAEAETQTGRWQVRKRPRLTFASDSKIKWTYCQLKKGDTLYGVFGPYTEAILRFNRIDQIHVYPGTYLKVPEDLNDIWNFSPMPNELPQANGYAKYVLVDLSEQFLGAYEYGELKFSFPIASGKNNSTPKGIFKIRGRDKLHRSSIYKIENTNISYPMNWGIKFHTSKHRKMFWIHGRDLPGKPASHGCIGLYDEEMQKKFYGVPSNPMLFDAKKLYLWLFPNTENENEPQEYKNGLENILIEII